VILFKFFPALTLFALLTLIFAAIKILYMSRARAMRAFAARRSFRYIGPPASKWFSPSHPKISPPLPICFSQGCHPYGSRIRQVWNVIEGQQGKVSVLIFDSIIGEGKGVYCTFVACDAEQNPFGVDTKPDHIIQSGGWTAVYRVRFVQIPWTMGIKRIDDYVNMLRVGSVCEPSCR
jgi:hypothetical protein